MKIRINVIAAVTVAILAMSSTLPLSLAASDSQSKPISKTELKVLLKTAKEPADHRKIAEYYRREAQRLSAEAKNHRNMGEIYQSSPLPFEGKHVYGSVGLSHCRYWADLQTKEAKEAEALATLHDEMAKEAEQKH